MITNLETPVGTARLYHAQALAPQALLLLGHGAGGGVDAPELAGLAHRLPSRAITVVRFEQPWAVAGRRVVAPAAQLDAAWRTALVALADEHPGVPLFAGGRSNGARVACRSFLPVGHVPAQAGSVGGVPAQAGLVLSAFPLHPPGRPGTSRIAELSPVAGDALLVQTEGDPFGGADEVLAALARQGSAPARLLRLPGSGHGPQARSRAAREELPDVLDTIAAAVADFIEERLPV